MQQILTALIVTYILITKVTKADISVYFEPPVPQVNESVCISLNLTYVTNETYHNIHFMFKPPTYNETSIFSYENNTFYPNTKVIETFFKDRLVTMNETIVCLKNILQQDLAYPYQWIYDEDEISFRLRNKSEDQAPHIDAIFLEPVIPVFGQPLCYSMNYNVDDHTLVDNVVLSAKYNKDPYWIEIFELTDGSLQLNKNSTFYSKLNVTYPDYFCFTNLTFADNLIDFKLDVFDLNFKNTTQYFNSDYNGKLNGKTKINSVNVSPVYPKENESFCIHIDYNLNYNGSTNSLSVFNLTLNGEIFIYLSNDIFNYNLFFSNPSFFERVNKNKTTLTRLCLENPINNDSSIEFKWFIQDWKDNSVQKLFYLPGFAANDTFSVSETYNNTFDIGSTDLCLSVEFVLPYESKLIQISLFNRRPHYSWQKVFDYFVFDDEAKYFQTDNINPLSRRSNGFCFTEVTNDVIHKQYKWRVVKSRTLDEVAKEFSLISSDWQFDALEIFQIEPVPSVAKSSEELCLYLKYKFDSHTSLQEVNFGTVFLYNHQEIPESYKEIFHLSNESIVYNFLHPLVKSKLVEFERSSFDQICFASVETNDERFRSFKWFLKDSYNRETNMIYTIPDTTSMYHNITDIMYNPHVPEAGKPLCITVQYSGQMNHTTLHLNASLPGMYSPELIYSYSYMSDNTSICSSGDLVDLCNRINQSSSSQNKVCFNSVTEADSYRMFVWNLEDVNGFFNYQFSFDVFHFPASNPNVRLHNRQFEYEAGDHISANCSFDNVTVNPKLSWYINNELYTGADTYYYYTNFTSSNSNWFISAESQINVKITTDMLEDGKNILLTCQGEIGHKGAKNEKAYKKYKSSFLIPVKGSKNDNETVVNSLTFEPYQYSRSKPLCISLNYTTASDVFSVSLVQGHGKNSKVIYEYANGKVSFPDNVNLTNRIDYKNTANTRFCLLDVEKVDEQEYKWIVSDYAKNQVVKTFELMSYEDPEHFEVKVFDLKDYYQPEDLVEGHCLMRNVRPQPNIQLCLAENPFPSNWSLNITSHNDDSYNSVVIFAFKLTSEMITKNMSLISCEYLIGDSVKDKKQIDLNFNKKGGDKPNKGLSGGSVAGIIIGTIIIVILLFGIGYYVYLKRYSKSENQYLIPKE